MLTLFRFPKSCGYTMRKREQQCQYAAYSQDEILESHLDFNPFVVGQRRPDEIVFRDCVLVGPQDNLRLFVIYMKTAKEQDET